jgi:hypothetical protein
MSKFLTYIISPQFRPKKVVAFAGLVVVEGVFSIPESRV